MDQQQPDESGYVSSSDLSSLHDSPSPPPYLSPSPSSQESSAKASPAPESMAKRPVDASGRTEDGEAPAPKRRRTTEPKPRTTQYLSLQNGYELDPPEQKSALDRLLKALTKKRKIVVIAGAGISVSAGSKLGLA
jgi:NAD+-dependent protein deacetylase SIR2